MVRTWLTYALCARRRLRWCAYVPTLPYDPTLPYVCVRAGAQDGAPMSLPYSMTLPYPMYVCPQAPEMVRVPLEELVLQIHLLRLGPAAGFLSKVLEPPPAKSVDGALKQLQAIGALTADEQLTPLGAAAAFISGGAFLERCVEGVWYVLRGNGSSSFSCVCMGKICACAH